MKAKERESIKEDKNQGRIIRLLFLWGPLRWHLTLNNQRMTEMGGTSVVRVGGIVVTS